MCPERGRPIVTLLTDFGEEDGYVAAVKGVIYSIAPAVRIVDVGHYVPSYQVSSAAYVLGTYYMYYPPGTVHAAVVDPGVGGGRKAIVVEAAGQFFVAPDNGIVTFIVQRHTESRQYEITEPRYMLPHVSATFHGRDVFAPAAAHLALGAPPDAFGPPLAECVQLPNARPEVSEGRVRGTIIHVDRFGNFITNVTREHLDTLESPGLLFRVKRFTMVGLSRTFSDREKGEPVVYVGSSGYVEIGVVQGSASRTIPATIGDEVTVWAGRKIKQGT